MRSGSSALVFAALAATLVLATARPASATTEPVVSTLMSNPSHPFGVAFDGSGNLDLSLRYGLGGSAIWRCTPPDPTVSNWTNPIVDPMAMVFDNAGNLWVADYDNGSSSGGAWKIAPDGSQTLVAHFTTGNNVSSITSDAAGNIYVGEYFNLKIDKITPAGVMSTYVPSIASVPTRLTMLYMDTNGTLYAGTNQGVIYKIGPGGSPITTFAGTLPAVVGFTRGPDGNFYSSSYSGGQIFKITPAGAATVYAGIANAASLVDGPASTARFNYPSQIVWRGNQLFIADYGNNAIRVITDLNIASPTITSTWGRLKALYR